MPILVDNLQWMSWNVLLAILPIIFCYLSIRYSERFIGFIFFILWFLFFPNTIYLITDLQYLPGQISTSNASFDVVLIFEYLLLILIGVFSYLFALKPMIKKLKNKSMEVSIVFLFNFLVAFAVALGKIQRTESWDVIFNPAGVINSILKNFSNPNILAFIVLFGILINIIWFFGNKRVKDLPFHL